ncbi:MAG: DUF4252 domain-containing protein [Bacteroidales bacterium]
MKRIAALFLIMFSLNLGSTFAQPFIDNVFNKYAGKKGFTSVMISPELFKLLSLVDKEDKELKLLSEKIMSLKVLVSEDKAIGFTNDIRSELSKSDYHSIMEVIDGNQKVNFYIKQEGETISDLILLAIDDNEEVLLAITGNMKMSDLSALGKNGSFGSGTGHLTLLKDLEEK